MNTKNNSIPSVKILHFQFFIFVVSMNILIILIYFLPHLRYDISKNPKTYDGDYTNTQGRMYDIVHFKYLISKTECVENSSAPYFVTMVNSSPLQFERRAACRDTWAHSDSRTKTYFMMGIPQSESLQKRIDAEEAQYHDIIQGNFIDSYHNLTYKHTMGLKWFTENCRSVKYMLKLDDDVFVNVPATYELLANNKKDTKFIMGIYYPPQPTGRNGKWKMSVEEHRDNFLPEYASGQSVIYSNDFVRDAYQRTLTSRYLWIDDVLISGHIRMLLNVRIEPIYPWRLADDALNIVLNGTNTTLPEPMFIVSEHNRNYTDMVNLWNLTESYRKLRLQV